MREILIARLLDFKRTEKNFNRDTSRWKYFTFNGDSLKGEKHISEIDFLELSDKDLVRLFETVVMRFYKQM